MSPRAKRYTLLKPTFSQTPGLTTFCLILGTWVHSTQGADTAAGDYVPSRSHCRGRRAAALLLQKPRRWMCGRKPVRPTDRQGSPT